MADVDSAVPLGDNPTAPKSQLREYGGRTGWPVVHTIMLLPPCLLSNPLSDYLGTCHFNCSTSPSPFMWYSAIFYFASHFFSALFYYIASYRGPGFLPIVGEVQMKDKGAASLRRDNTTSSDAVDHRTFCDICKTLQDIRCKHCKECNRCVLKYDHHCGWMETCVGQKNHAFFWWYLVWEAVCVVWTIILTYHSLLAADDGWMAFAIVFLIAGICGLCAPGSLCCITTYMCLSRNTTWEVDRRHRITYLQQLPREYKCPFSRGDEVLATGIPKYD